MKRRKLIAFITTIALLVGCFPATASVWAEDAEPAVQVEDVQSADPVEDVQTDFELQDYSADFSLYALADYTPANTSPNAIIITRVAEYGQEVIAVAISLGGIKTLGQTSLAAINTVLSVGALTYDISVSPKAIVYNGDRAVTNAYLNDVPELIVGGSTTDNTGKYLILELSNGNSFDPATQATSLAATTLRGSRPLELNYYVKLKQDFGTDLLKPGRVIAKMATGGVKNLIVDEFEDGISAEGLNYKLYKPTRAALSAKKPLVVWVHGGGEGSHAFNGVETFDGSQILANQGGTGWVEAARLNPTLEAYVLAPQANGRWDWGTAKGDDVRIDALIKQIIAANPAIDTNRIYISGCSNGGAQTLSQLIYSTLAAGNVKFAGAIIDCPSLSYSRPNQTRLLTDSDLNAIKGIPMWFYQAATDPTVQEPGTTNTIEALKQLAVKELIYSHPAAAVGSISGNDYNDHWIWVNPLANVGQYVNDPASDVRLVGGVTYANLGGSVTNPINWLFEHSLAKPTVTVTYHYNNPPINGTTTQAVSVGGMAVPPSLTLTDSAFAGWYSDSSLSAPFDTNAKAVTENIDLYAKWDAVAASDNLVRFESNGGTKINDVVVASGSAVTTGAVVPPPVKAGFRFKGWYSNDTFTGTEWNLSTTPVTAKTITLYAKWVSATTLSVVSNGTSGVTGLPLVRVIDDGTLVNDLPFATSAFSRTNFHFKDYFYKGAVATTRTAITGAAATLNVEWESNFFISFLPNGGTLTAPAKVFGNTNGIVAKPTDPTPPSGKAFDKWVSGSAITGSEFNFAQALTKSVTLTAIYADGYTVKYDANGGTWTGGLTSKAITVVSGSSLLSTSAAVQALGNPSKPSSSFAGWYNSSTVATTATAIKYPITKAGVYYAHYTAVTPPVTPASFNVTFNANGGTWGTTRGSIITVSAVGQLTATMAPTAPLKTLSTFSGWYTDKTAGTAIVWPVTKAAVYYAHWTTESGGWVRPPSGGSGSGSSSSSTTPETPSTTPGAVTPDQPSVTGPFSGFSDASSISSWAAPFIEKLVRAGVISGYSDGTLKPQGNVTRAEFTKMIVAGLKLTASGTAKSFPDDVKAGDWYKEFVDIASANNIVNGVSATSFAPNANISRQDLAAIAYRALVYLNADIPAPSANKFSDDAKIADYAKDAVYVLRELAIVSGRTDGSFDPLAFATREETAKIICGVMDYVAPSTAAQTAPVVDVTAPTDGTAPEDTTSGSAVTSGSAISTKK